MKRNGWTGYFSLPRPGAYGSAWPARRRLALVVGCCLVAGLALGWSLPLRAQPGPRAGLVVAFGDGSTKTFCVNLGGGERTGEELLRLAGLEVTSMVTALGAQVCRVGGVGCDYPAEACWCRCKDLGANCTYWAYSTLENGRWVYAALGATSRTVRDGDVDGWAWGRGTEGRGAEPPVRTWAEICAVADSPPTGTATPGADPTASPRPTPLPPTAASGPSATPRTRTPAKPGPTPRASTTPRTSSTPRPGSTAGLSTTPRAAATLRTLTPPAAQVETPDPERAWLRATVAALLATMTAVAAPSSPTATLPPTTPTPLPTVLILLSGSLTRTPADTSNLATTPTPGPEGVTADQDGDSDGSAADATAVGGTRQAGMTAGDTSSPAARAGAQRNRRGLVAFGLVAAWLLALLVWLRRR